MLLSDLKLTKKRLDICNKLELITLEDLMRYYPHRYEVLEAQPFNEWEKDGKVFFEGIIVSQAKVLRLKGKLTLTTFQMNVQDEIITISIFNRPWISNFTQGKKIVIQGKYQGNYKVVASKYYSDDINTLCGIKPLYHLKEGISEKDILKLLDIAYPIYASHYLEFIPKKYLDKYRLISGVDALYYVHHPKSKEHLKQSLRYLKYEEFLRFQLWMNYVKQNQQQSLKLPKCFDIEDVYELNRALDFTLSKDQNIVIQDILNDLKSQKIMYRMVQGDVGCGKTIVACYALYACVLSHQQAVLLAPTELLAKQHVKNITKLFQDFKVNVAGLYSSLKPKEKEDILKRLKNNEIDILIGTHALFQDQVTYHNLGLVVVDEHHRFGVKQRRSMLEKGDNVDFLLMSATPIPRTLAISLCSDMDVSTIQTLPSNRKAIITKYYQSSSMQPCLEFILSQVDEGRQVYVVCPAIENNEDYQMKNVIDIYDGMQKVLGKKYQIALLHGGQMSSEKDEIMASFVEGKIQIMVSTTVIEVGVDVKNANVMVIYDAHRFGMSQIHQLRGRVGRGEHQGYCFLLSNSKEEDSIKRLKVLESCNDGFEISRKDLELRGPGDILGTRQSGAPDFILGNVIEDQKILEVSGEDAKEIIMHLDEYPHIKTYLEQNMQQLNYLD